MLFFENEGCSKNVKKHVNPTNFRVSIAMTIGHNPVALFMNLNIIWSKSYANIAQSMKSDGSFAVFWAENV